MSVFTITQEAEVAGFFYPKHQVKISSLLEKYFENAQENKNIAQIDKKPLAIIAPHAGYKYSGNIAAVAYQALEKFKAEYSRIVIIGPGHQMHFRGAAYYFSDFYETPMGTHKIATDLRQELLIKQLMLNVDPAFKGEHSLEVHLPFIAKTFGLDIPIMPILFGSQTKYELITKIIEESDDGKTLFIISTDLSHFHNDKTQKELDHKTITNIIGKNYDALTSDDACGAGPVKGLLKYATEKNYQVTELAVGSSSDESGDTDSVVGYASFVVY